MSYKQILEMIPGEAKVGVKRIPAFAYLNNVVEKLAIKELGYENGLDTPFNPKSKEFLRDLELSTVVEKLEETADMEIHPRGWNFSDPAAAYAHRAETRIRAMGLLKILSQYDLSDETDPVKTIKDEIEKTKQNNYEVK